MEDLCVNKRKIKEVKEWMEASLSSSSLGTDRHNKLLVLLGPPGVGKSTVCERVPPGMEQQYIVIESQREPLSSARAPLTCLHEGRHDRRHITSSTGHDRGVAMILIDEIPNLHSPAAAGRCSTARTTTTTFCGIKISKRIGRTDNVSHGTGGDITC